jgi:hypothetical protein
MSSSTAAARSFSSRSLPNERRRPPSPPSPTSLQRVGPDHPRPPTRRRHRRPSHLPRPHHRDRHRELPTQSHPRQPPPQEDPAANWGQIKRARWGQSGLTFPRGLRQNQRSACGAVPRDPVDPAAEGRFVLWMILFGVSESVVWAHGRASEGRWSARTRQWGVMDSASGRPGGVWGWPELV